MAKFAAQIATVGLIAIALAACGKSEEKAVQPAPQPAATTVDIPKVREAPAMASRQLAGQKSATEAARCGVVFATAADAADRGGDKKGIVLMNRATQAVQYVIDVAISDRGELPQSIKDAQAEAVKGAEFWSQQQFETLVDQCTRQFADLAPLMEQEGVFK